MRRKKLGDRIHICYLLFFPYIYIIFFPEPIRNWSISQIWCINLESLLSFIQNLNVSSPYNFYILYHAFLVPLLPHQIDLFLLTRFGQLFLVIIYSNVYINFPFLLVLLFLFLLSFFHFFRYTPISFLYVSVPYVLHVLILMFLFVISVIRIFFSFIYY